MSLPHPKGRLSDSPAQLFNVVASRDGLSTEISRKCIESYMPRYFFILCHIKGPSHWRLIPYTGLCVVQLSLPGVFFVNTAPRDCGRFPALLLRAPLLSRSLCPGWDL